MLFAELWQMWVNWRYGQVCGVSLTLISLWPYGISASSKDLLFARIKNGRNPVPSWKQAKTTKTRVPSVPKKSLFSQNFWKIFWGKVFLEINPPEFRQSKKTGFAKKPGFFGPQNLPRDETKTWVLQLGFRSTTPSHQSGRIGRIGWSHDRTGRAETKTCCFFGNTILFSHYIVGMEQ